MSASRRVAGASTVAPISHSGAAEGRELANAMLRLSLLCSAVAGIAAMSTLVGLMFGVAWLESFMPGRAPSRAGSAMAMLASAVAVALMVRQSGGRPLQLVRRALGVLVMLLGTGTLIEYAAGPHARVVQLLPGHPALAHASTPGRITPDTAWALLLCGAAIAGFTRGTWRAEVATWAGVGIAAISFVTLIGYAAHLGIYLDTGADRMALPSALMLVFIGLGIALGSPDRGALALAARSGPAGHMARRLLPVALVAPLLAGLARWLGRPGSLYGADVGILLMIVLTICVMVFAIVRAALALDEVESERRAVELEHQLQSRVTQNLLEGVGVVRWQDDTIVYANPRLAELIGVPPGALVGEPLANLRYEAEDPDTVVRECRDALATDGYWSAELRYIRADGSRFWGQVTVTKFEHPVHGDVSVVVIADVTARHDAEESISQQAELLESVLRATERHAIICTDLEGQVVVFNAGAERMLGYSAADMVGRHTPTLLHDPEELRARAAELGIEPGLAAVAHQALRGSPETRDWTYIRQDGARLLVSLTVTVINGADGRPAGLIGVATDVTEERQAQRALHEAEEQFRRSFDDALIGMQVFDLDGRFVRVNDAFCAIVGYDRRSLVGLLHEAITHPDDHAGDADALAALMAGETKSFVREKRYLHRSGRFVWASVSVTMVRDARGVPLHLIGQAQDITERRHYEEQLRHMADHDHLTGLLNRRSFERELHGHVRRVKRFGPSGALLMIDLDNFKFYNDTKGHKAGDDLIVRISGALRTRLRDSDTVARLGGDEFAVLLPRADRVAAELVATELLAAVQDQVPAAPAGRRRRVTASIGVALFEHSKTATADEMMVRADLAMYDAKERGRNQCAFYSSDQQERPRLASQMRWTSAIGDALAGDGFELLAQPICSLQLRKCGQFELLLRMRLDTGDLVPPASFLYVAERNGLVTEIDRWVTDQAISLLALHRAAGHDLRLEVNLSGLTIGDGELIELVERRLRETGVPPEALIFEVTETAAIENMAGAVAFAQRLSDVGCKFALDDFGAGFGSFYYLKHLPFDYLKIDGEFVRNCAHSETDQTLIAAVVEIARGMGKLTIAEYVENQETIDVISALGVDLAQGYQLGEPAPLAHYLAADEVPGPA